MVVIKIYCPGYCHVLKGMQQQNYNFVTEVFPSISLWKWASPFSTSAGFSFRTCRLYGKIYCYQKRKTLLACKWHWLTYNSTGPSARKTQWDTHTLLFIAVCYGTIHMTWALSSFIATGKFTYLVKKHDDNQVNESSCTRGCDADSPHVIVVLRS